MFIYLFIPLEYTSPLEFLFSDVTYDSSFLVFSLSLSFTHIRTRTLSKTRSRIFLSFVLFAISLQKCSALTYVGGIALFYPREYIHRLYLKIDICMYMYVWPFVLFSRASFHLPHRIHPLCHRFTPSKLNSTRLVTVILRVFFSFFFPFLTC